MNYCVCISCANTNLSGHPLSHFPDRKSFLFFLFTSTDFAGEEVRLYCCFGSESCVVLWAAHFHGIISPCVYRVSAYITASLSKLAVAPIFPN